MSHEFKPSYGRELRNDERILRECFGQSASSEFIHRDRTCYTVNLYAAEKLEEAIKEFSARLDSNDQQRREIGWPKSEHYHACLRDARQVVLFFRFRLAAAVPKQTKRGSSMVLKHDSNECCHMSEVRTVAFHKFGEAITDIGIENLNLFRGFAPNGEAVAKGGK